MAEFSEKDLADLEQAGQLAVFRLTDEERKVLDQIDNAKSDVEKKLRRPLNDEEAIVIEDNIPGGQEVVARLSDLTAIAFSEVRNKGKGRPQ